MHQQQEPARDSYPHGRGYGHDYMRGGEVLDGYGYSTRPEYSRRRGDADDVDVEDAGSGSEVVNS
ncbi:MAG TPA: hypothetical protein VGQ52_10965 [Gemmatimonadaceae bacterium]|jgi:hypothetical protein|nr:hypothetical protein [Gemmatimonadaceae bacterium]